MAFVEIAVPALYALSMLVLTAYALNLLWLSVWAVRKERPLPGPVPDAGAMPSMPRSLPSVTVQLPIYNEPAVAERLIDACAQLAYPQRLLEIQVLDDSTDETADLAAARIESWHRRGVDIVHVRRAGRSGYKAGALANGMAFARGDLIAVFDADFLPAPDFLRRVVPEFDAPDVGLVQTRWAHMNENESLLTRVQAFGLDTHFAVEQRVRADVGCFINFNGTAGVWRRECIEDAGGWSADTLTEDLDLSYRAQLGGWRLKYLHEVEVPAELPARTDAFRSQQFRWAKGSVQTALRTLPAVWRSGWGLRVKLEGTAHLTAHLVFPFVLVAALLHAPLVWLKETGRGPGAVYFALLGFGLLGLAGFFLAQLYAQRSLYPDWRVRLRLFPSYMAGTMGLSVSNTRAVWQALVGKTSPFVRTPKQGSAGSDDRTRKLHRAATGLPAIVWLEAMVLLYSLAATAFVVDANQWTAIPFQFLVAVGFMMIVWFSVRDWLALSSSRLPSAGFEPAREGAYLASEYSVRNRSE